MRRLPFFLKPALEVVARQADRLAGDERLQVVVQPLEVERLQRFEVVGAVFPTRRRLPVDEEAVELEGERSKAARQKVDGGTLGGRRLGRGRRPGDEDDA